MDQHKEPDLLASPEGGGRVVRCPAIGAPAFLANLAARSGETGESIHLDLSDPALELDFMMIQALVLLARESSRQQLGLTLFGCDDDRLKRLRCSGVAPLLTIAALPNHENAAETALMTTAS